MPQMMPMFWLLMLSTMIFSLMLIMILTYFLHLFIPPLKLPLSSNKLFWYWKW